LTLKLGSMFTLGGMNDLRVAELAARAGVAASTVRFYERAGLLSPARRAENGYRVFDESALEELAFIQRAKAIGMSLEDIAGLVAVWPSGSCQSLQAQMRVHLAEQISAVCEQRAGLDAFERQLRTVLGRLSARDPGPERCGRGCGCEIDLELGSGGAAPGLEPWGCSLEPDAFAARTGEWQEVAAAAATVEHTDGSVRLALPADPGVIATVAGLCAAETQCCPQARFVLEVTASQMILTLQAPPGDRLLQLLVPGDTLIRR
jgi:MerR family transcriptional regulator, copper efflux regulator